MIKNISSSLLLFTAIAPVYGLTGFDQGWEKHPFSILDSIMNCTNENKYMFTLFT